jgi:hypothetical protein
VQEPWQQLDAQDGAQWLGKLSQYQQDSRLPPFAAAQAAGAHHREEGGGGVEREEQATLSVTRAQVGEGRWLVVYVRQGPREGRLGCSLVCRACAVYGLVSSACCHQQGVVVQAL